MSSCCAPLNMVARKGQPRGPRESKPSLPTLPQLIERIGFGATHLRFLATGGGIWVVDGAGMLLISATSAAIAAEWNLDAMQRGSLVTAVYMGVLIGSLTCGPLGDHYGRRLMVLVSYAGIFIFSILSSYMETLLSLNTCRVVVGFFFGLGQAPWNVLGTEVTPSKWRSVMIACSLALFALGEIYSAFLIMLDDPQMHRLHWRQLLVLGAVPSLLFGIASCFFLYPSPFFLAQRGEYDQAKEVLAVMQQDNAIGAPPTDLEDESSVDFRHVLPSSSPKYVFEQLKELYDSPLFPSTLILMYTSFVVNFASHGSLYAFPHVLPSLIGNTGSTSFELIVGALWELPGIALGCIGCISYPRKTMLKVYLIVVCSSAFLFLLGVAGGSAWLPFLVCRAGYYSLKCSLSIGVVVLYLYISELYPTPIRTTGTAIGFASGRFAAMIAPLVFEKFLESTRSFGLFFVTIICMVVINLVFIDLLPFETFGAALPDSYD